MQASEFKPHIVIKGRTVKVQMPYYVCIFIKNFRRIQQNPLKPFTFGGVAAGKVSEWMGIGIACSLTYMCCHCHLCVPIACISLHFNVLLYIKK